MAIYHLSLKAIQRSKGRSSTASAAYRSRSKITDSRTGITYDYTRKKGIEARAIFTPDGSQISRSDLWNLAEEAERRKDGITAREYELALPCELDKKKRMELTRDFCLMLMERYGIAIDVAIHAPTKDGDQRNFHAHVQTTTRKLVNGSLGAKSDFELSGTERRKKGLKSQKEELQDIRQEWERMINAKLEQAGRPERVSCKSLPEQGESRPPTIHLGLAATALERKGIQTERGDLNRWPALRRMYGELQEMKKDLRALEAEITRTKQEKREDNEPGRKQPGMGERPQIIIRRNAGVDKAAKSQDGERGARAESANGSNANQATVRGSERPVQPNSLSTGRVETPSENTGRAERGYLGIAGQPERNIGLTRENFRDTQRISSENKARGITSRPGCGQTAGGSGRTDRDDLGRGREVRRSSWLERLKQLEAALISRIIEYRTIGDLLAMNQRKRGEEKARQEEKEVKNRQITKNRPKP